MALKKGRHLVYQRYSQKNCYSFCFHVPNLKEHNQARKYKNVKNPVVEIFTILINTRQISIQYFCFILILFFQTPLRRPGLYMM
jgi:hypothetical protein